MVISFYNALGRTLPAPIPTQDIWDVGVSRPPCVPQDSAVLESQSLIAGPGAQSWPFLSYRPAPTPPTPYCLCSGLSGILGLGVGWG